MTDEEINGFIARLVYGYVVIIDTQSGKNYMMGKDRSQIPVPDYCTEMCFAEEIEEMMERQGFVLQMQNTVDYEKSKWLAMFGKPDGRKYLPSMAETLPRAVCLAAIAAIQGANIPKEE